MIRPRGIAIIVLAIALFGLAGVTRVGWFLLFDAVLWGTVVVSAATPWLAIGKISIHRRISGWKATGGEIGPSEGDSVELDLKLHNNGIFPCMFVTVRYDLPEEAIESEKKGLLIAWLGRKKGTSSSLELSFRKRGLYRLPQFRIETALPFGPGTKGGELPTPPANILYSRETPQGS